ncbi:MAG: hypothetical protein JSS41_11815 [Proteobacteria bacterium]|nr:hypothetical protein [Pseudomonadota bacterium]
MPEPLPVPEPPSAVESARAEESPLAVEAPPAPEAPQPVHGEQEPDPMARFVAHQAQMQELHERAISAKQGQRWNDMVSAAETLQASATQANDRQSELQASRLLATAHANLRNYPMVFHCSSQAVVLARELHDADLPTDEHRLRTFVTALRPHLIDSGDADTVQALTAAEALIDAG